MVGAARKAQKTSLSKSDDQPDSADPPSDIDDCTTSDERKEIHSKLRDETKFTLEEGRMTLPGIQALFGFQLVSVFSSEFDEKVLPEHKIFHLVAIGLTMLAIALTMTPAAYDRQSKQSSCSKKFIRIASTCITLGMLPLSISMAIDLFIISFLITKEFAVSAAAGGVALTFFLLLWFVYPNVDKTRKHDH